MDILKIDWKDVILMLIFAVIVVAGLQIAGMWMWILSSGAVPAYESGIHIIIALIGAVLAINGLLKILAGMKSKTG